MLYDQFNLFKDGKVAPGEQLRLMLDERGWTQEELADLIGRSRQQIIDIVAGRRGITAETAVALGAALGTSAEYWMGLDAAYRLSQVGGDASSIQRRLAIVQLAPVREMQKRGWINATKAIEDVEDELKRFFGVGLLDEIKSHPFAMRKTDALNDLTTTQRAWCYRVKQLAASQLVAEFKPELLPQCEQQLRKLAANPEDANKVPKILAEYGIRFVVVEPLQSSKVEGVALWLDDKSPVIGMSMRYDRVDSFWFTLCHEFSHVKHRDDAPLDADLTDPSDTLMLVKSAMERRADDEAASALIPREELESFILRVGPLYSKDRVSRFANRIRIHPGIIVGQLQHRKEIGYSALRDCLGKIRHFLLPAAIVDGWGYSIDPRSFNEQEKGSSPE
jgi:HTH-type transcriptional regulator/antitoxin HigA